MVWFISEWDKGTSVPFFVASISQSSDWMAFQVRGASCAISKKQKEALSSLAVPARALCYL